MCRRLNVPVQRRQLAHQRPYVWNEKLFRLVLFDVFELQVRKLLNKQISRQKFCSLYRGGSYGELVFGPVLGSLLDDLEHLAEIDLVLV